MGAAKTYKLEGEVLVNGDGYQVAISPYFRKPGRIRLDLTIDQQTFRVGEDFEGRDRKKRARWFAGQLKVALDRLIEKGRSIKGR